MDIWLGGEEVERGRGRPVSDKERIVAFENCENPTEKQKAYLVPIHIAMYLFIYGLVKFDW